MTIFLALTVHHPHEPTKLWEKLANLCTKIIDELAVWVEVELNSANFDRRFKNEKSGDQIGSALADVTAKGK